jgi:hypothetical protein
MQHISTANRYTSPFPPNRTHSRISFSFILESQLYGRIEHHAFAVLTKDVRSARIQL